MGNLHTSEYARLYKSGQLSLDAALSVHLTSNHYPPISPAFIDAAKTAIALTNKGQLSSFVDLPNGRTVPVSEVLDHLHLDAFTTIYDDPDEDEDAEVYYENDNSDDTNVDGTEE